MADPVIALHGVSKTFGRRHRRVDAVQNISLQVESGQVYGFLGPNGAGKSTTIRMIMDLVRPTAGNVFVYGRNVQKEPLTLRRAGALVEGAKFYPFLTGRQNLEVLARTASQLNKGRIQQLLTFVNMADRADRKVKGYSTGMKQRLGLAAALLEDPDLLILDEPTNGLDPAGIQEIRAIIRDLSQNQGKTIFLSSHMLHEVEIICDQVGIIDQGTLLFEGSVSQLQHQESQLLIEADPQEAARALIAEKWPVTIDSGQLSVTIPRDEIPNLVQLLARKGIAIFQMVPLKKSLESFYLELTQNGREMNNNDVAS